MRTAQSSSAQRFEEGEPDGAWQFVNTWEPLYRAEVAAPVADEGQVVIDVKAAGLCHSDGGMLTDPGWRELLAYRPITIGHEVPGLSARSVSQ